MIKNRTTLAVAKLLGYETENLVSFQFLQTGIGEPNVVASYEVTEYDVDTDIVDLILAVEDDDDDTETFFPEV